MRSNDVWGELEAARAQLEGQAGPAALFGGMLGLVLEGWRYLSATAEKVDATLQELEARLERARLRIERRLTNTHRVAGSGLGLSNVNTTISNNGGSVHVEANSTATDQAARIRVTAGSVSVLTSTLAHVGFARSFGEVPVVLAQQDSGADIGISIANVTTNGFDLVTGAGMAPAQTVTVVVSALSPQLAESVA